MLVSTDRVFHQPGTQKAALFVTGVVWVAYAVYEIAQVEVPIEPKGTDPVSLLIWFIGILLVAIGSTYALSWKYLTGTNTKKLDQILEKLDDIENEIIRGK